MEFPEISPQKTHGSFMRPVDEQKDVSILSMIQNTQNSIFDPEIDFGKSPCSTKLSF